MKQRALGYAALAAAMMLSIGMTATAGENTWVTDKGHNVQLDGHKAMFFGEGATELQVDDLADGETRVIGVGEKQITASRRGDEVTLARAAAGEDAALNIKCTIGTDTCKIISFEDDPGKVMLIIEKTRRCENGEGDCNDVEVMVHAAAGAEGGHHMIHTMAGEPGEGVHVIRIKKSVECDAAGNCEELEEVLGNDDGAMADVIIESLGAGAHASGKHGENVFVLRGDQVTLRCSEGDTTMTVDKKEADDVFLCPKHSTPLEQAASHPRVIRHKIKRDRDSD